MTDAVSNEVIVERLDNLLRQFGDLRREVATKADYSHVSDDVRDLVIALESERVARAAGDTKIAERVQAIEDRNEARRFQLYSSMGLAILGSVLSIGTLLIGPLLAR